MKFISLLILFYFLMILQISFATEATLVGSRPNLILLVLCFALFWYRNANVFLWGILAGLLCETFDASIPGTGVLLLTCLIWIAFRIQIHFQIRSIFSRVVLMIIFTFVFDGLFHLLNRVDASTSLDFQALAQNAAGNAIYTGIAGLCLLIFFKVILRLVPAGFGQNMRNETVYETRFSH